MKGAGFMTCNLLLRSNLQKIPNDLALSSSTILSAVYLPLTYTLASSLLDWVFAQTAPVLGVYLLFLLFHHV